MALMNATNSNPQSSLLTNLTRRRPQRTQHLQHANSILVAVLLLAMFSTVECQAQEEGPPEIVLTVSPAAEPVPALKYLLMPDPTELRPGNAATLYYKAMVFEGPDPYDSDERDKIVRWLDTPVKDLPLGEVEQTVSFFSRGYSYRDTREAAYQEYCVWADPIEEFGMSTLLPEVQRLRGVGRFLGLKCRLEIAQHKYGDAIETLKAGYALARNMANGESLVHVLVGLAIQSTMDAQAAELIAAEGSPNLYWALASMPQPLIAMRKAAFAERKFVEYSLHAIRDAKSRTLTEDEARTLAFEVWDFANDFFLEDRYAATLWALRRYPEAKKRLLSEGRTLSEIEAMPALQVVLLESLADFERVRDDSAKWMFVSEWSPDQMGRSDNALKLARRDFKGMPFIELVPAFQTAKSTELRYIAYLDALRVIEALRIFAADHARWPHSLAEIDQVPVPNNVLTGQPFGYSASDDVATVEIQAPPEMPSIFGRVYRLKLRPTPDNQGTK